MGNWSSGSWRYITLLCIESGLLNYKFSHCSKSFSNSSRFGLRSFEQKSQRQFQIRVSTLAKFHPTPIEIAIDENDWIMFESSTFGRLQSSSACLNPACSFSSHMQRTLKDGPFHSFLSVFIFSKLLLVQNVQYSWWNSNWCHTRPLNQLSHQCCSSSQIYFCLFWDTELVFRSFFLLFLTSWVHPRNIFM